MEYRPESSISIQVSLSGYSFKVDRGVGSVPEGWLPSDRLFTTVEMQRRYDRVEISLLTPKVALVPSQFFRPEEARGALEDVCVLRASDSVEWIDVPWFAATLVYSLSMDESLSGAVSRMVYTTSGNNVKVLPEMYYLLVEVTRRRDYNKIVASYMDGKLHLVIAQGRSLMLCNVYDAPDFTTAQYYLFLAMKKLQLNPEVSTVCMRTPLTREQEMSLYRYFSSVEVV